MSYSMEKLCKWAVRAQAGVRGCGFYAQYLCCSTKLFLLLWASVSWFASVSNRARWSPRSFHDLITNNFLLNTRLLLWQINSFWAHYSLWQWDSLFSHNPTVNATPGFIPGFFKISFSHINLKYYLSEPDCQSWRGLKKLGKFSSWATVGLMEWRNPSPNQVFACASQILSKISILYKQMNNNNKKKTVCCPPLAISRLGYSGLSYFFHHRDVKRGQRGDQHYKKFCPLAPEFHWLRIPLNHLVLRQKNTLITTA